MDDPRSLATPEVSPAKSRKQQRFLFAKKGAAWVKRHHFDKLKRKRGKK